MPVWLRLGNFWRFCVGCNARLAVHNVSCGVVLCERRGSLYGMLHSPTVQLSWGQVAFICWGAAKGMQHLHGHNVIHRDLKSGTTLLSRPLTNMTLSLLSDEHLAHHRAV